MKKLGLIGYPLGHSFSKKFYLEKFERENISDINYDLYPLETLDGFQTLYDTDPNFCGFNVTIPHKRNVMAFLDELSPEAEEINAVNCVRIERKNGKAFLKGFNTDAFGFEQSLRPLLTAKHQTALVFGNGGAAQAVYYALKKLGISYRIVSRQRDNGDLTYTDLTEAVIRDHKLLVNCSPVGTFPNIQECPHIPYEGIGESHLLYDLIYNPEETLFLKKGKERGATTKNGYEMLVLQAERNWKIWNEV
ncbi:shikimate dehydrogenase family protein [Sphingobacterium griseoflavum]|uniref:Shikimate 5-dehydrogenase n=1 Tax=Sphingobacterium griseoflavum TaxID=1474952 RepID=A0ABQ3I3B5_9SPHI|nr:shikimate dehydrogenase [Sphingobacterium griseoflavum]GHE46275.1 shikimate 5-dehydrogenase [Sphingobacterium griseoflavum]